MRHTTVKPATHNAIGCLLHLTNGNSDPWALAGRASVKARQSVMSLILGKRATQNESGVTAIRAALHDGCQITGNCPADRDQHFREFVQKIFPGLEVY